MSIRHSILIRAKLSFVAMAIFGGLVVLRILYIQVVQGEKWEKRAEQNGLTYRTIKANRGDILSDDGTILATSMPLYKAAIDPTVANDSVFIKGIDSLSYLLAKYFKEKTALEVADELKKARQDKRKYKLLCKKFLNYQEKKMLQTFPILREGKKGGSIFEKTEQRLRPFDELGRRTIGFVGNDSAKGAIGRGLEYSFNHILGGKEGQALFQRIAGGDWKPMNDGSMIRPEDGYDIQTTIDIDLQEVADKSLRKALVEHDADYGCVIMMDVKTGAIKAIVNLSKMAESGYLEDNNYAIGNIGFAEPGSTFKIATMAALLEGSDVRLTDTVQTGQGKYEYAKDAVMTDATVGGHGKINVQSVFEKSSNIGLSKLVALKYFREQPEKFVEYLDKFGFTKPLNFQIAGEATPLVKRPADKAWTGVSLAWMSVGYEMKLSPLHILNFCNALANQGRLMQPHIVQRVMYADEVVEEYNPKVMESKVCSDKTLKTMQMLMEGVVERGTAKNIKSDLYKIAGKTGTAEKVENGKYSEKHYTSFVGYFPSDAPKYSCIVVIDNPKKEGRYAAQVAAPVFREIADFAYRNRVLKQIEIANAEKKVSAPVIKAGYAPDVKKICDEIGITPITLTNEEWVMARTSGDTVKLTGNPMRNDMVPNVIGMSLKDALYVLENKGLKVVFSGKGKVATQSLISGTKISRGGRIVLRLA